MKNKITSTKATSCREHGCQGKDMCSNPAETGDKQDDGRVYLINTKPLRVSSTKNWAKSLDQLRQQIKRGCGIDGVGIKDHFC
ncbi:hypothetical protein [Desulfosarcina sp.]|uniref:hypothetical protein n=1 Tax=Desulfosarcina sp. TaxID=2027861 RepID=UPI0039704BFA